MHSDCDDYPNRCRGAADAGGAFARRVVRFGASDGGASAVEHSLFLMIVAGGIFLTVTSLGLSGDGVFGSLAGRLSPGSARTTSHSAARSASSGSASFHADRQDGEPAGSPWRMLVLAAVISVLGVGYNISYLRRLQRKPLEEKDEPPAPLETAAAMDHVFVKRQRILQTLSADLRVLMESRLEVRHIMTNAIKCIPPNMPADVVRETMRHERLRHLLVCNRQRLIGIISDRDNMRHGRFAREMMTAKPLSVSPKTPVGRAVTMMIERRISCLPIVQGEVVCGVLTTTDLLMALQCALRLIGELRDADTTSQAVAGATNSDRGESQAASVMRPRKGGAEPVAVTRSPNAAATSSPLDPQSRSAARSGSPS